MKYLIAEGVSSSEFRQWLLHWSRRILWTPWKCFNSLCFSGNAWSPFMVMPVLVHHTLL